MIKADKLIEYAINAVGGYCWGAKQNGTEYRVRAYRGNHGTEYRIGCAHKHRKGRD